MPSLYDIIVQVAGAGGVLVALAGSAKWAWVEIDRRFEKIEEDLKACQSREHVSERRAAVKLTAIELMWQEVDRLSPDKPNATLRRVKTLLDSLKLPEPSMDLNALARELDRQRGQG